MTVAEPPFQPNPHECRECLGEGEVVGPGVYWLDQLEGIVCQHCKGTGRCYGGECQRERGK